MSDKIATSDPTQRDRIATNVLVHNTYASDNPTAEESLLDLGLGSQTTSNPPAAIEATSELLIPGLSSGRIHSIDAMNNFGNAAVDIDLLEKEIAAKEQARREGNFVDLTGEIAGVPGKQHRTRSSAVEPDLETDFDTLNEPVWDTIRRDLRMVGAKFGQVLVPRNDQQLLRDWDLWGPLFICVFISLLLQGADGGKGPRFTEVFSLTFFGSVIVTLNIKLLGGHISFFQSLCVLGYCLLPPATAAMICKLLEMKEQTSMLFALRLLVTGIGFIWATYASMAFLSGSQPERRKLLSVYPIFLFYFVVSWIIISHWSF
uniref:Protein YIPF n=1 Tax=Parascaris univalens TaxID=6257 RepID=A0A915BAQ9_PARUN